MKVELEHTEITQAIIDYVSTQGIDISDKEVKVNMTAGRGDKGYTADITIMDASLKERVKNSLDPDSEEDTTEPSGGLFPNPDPE